MFKKMHWSVQNWFIFRQQKVEFKQECLARSCHHATGCFLHFWVIFLYWMQAEIWKKNILLSSSRAFSLSTSMANSVATLKKATKCNKFNLFHHWFIKTNFCKASTVAVQIQKYIHTSDNFFHFIVICKFNTPWKQTLNIKASQTMSTHLPIKRNYIAFIFILT